MTDPDRLTAELAAIRLREQAASPDPWVVKVIPPRRSGFDSRPEAHMVVAGGVNIANAGAGDAAFIAAARSDVPRLLAAVDAALEHIRSGDDSAADGIAAISRALTGEDGSDGH